ncbi:MAG: hypothetical protein K8F91_25930, partial [Candidatus Obscuribacterales bacterium]|nr:hypothetical protein [Candidatus Obscuribacterales bacterium]
FIKPDPRSDSMSSILIQASAPLKVVAAQDLYSVDRRYIVEQLQEVVTPAPERVYVVVDSSEALASHATEIKKALSSIPSCLTPIVYFACEKDAEEGKLTSISSEPLAQALAAIAPDAFMGGQDNRALLYEALETAAEQTNSAVLWIHGPQPLAQNLSESTVLDLVHGVRLYDLQIVSGPNSILHALEMKDVSNLIALKSVQHQSISGDLQALLSGWEKDTTSLCIKRTISTDLPQEAVVMDRLASKQVSCLWAAGEVTRLIAGGEQKQAEGLAVKHRLITPVTGAVVLENTKDYESFLLYPRTFKSNPAQVALSTEHAIVGAPSDPRYGQSNEIGQLADFGYDTARDISRLLTLVSGIFSTFVAVFFLRCQKARTASAIGKAVAFALAVPIVVHVMGTFIINNYGGLGGGL